MVKIAAEQDVANVRLSSKLDLDNLGIGRYVLIPVAQLQLIQPTDGIIDQIELLRGNAEMEAHIPFQRLRATCGLMFIAHALMNLG